MKIAIVTSIKAPYRTLQFEEIYKNKDIEMIVYYTKQGGGDRNWEVKNSNTFKEIYLNSIKLFDRFGTLNTGLKDIVENNDIVILGGYEKPTYIIMSLLCRIYKKKYIIIFDGITCNRLNEKENKFKKLLKNLVIKHSFAIWGNGTVSKRYFNEVFNYPVEQIYNQYLTVDGDKIRKIGENKESIRKELRNKYGIDENEKVIQYSGRLIEIKNIKSVIKAISKIEDQKIMLLITGSGEQEEELKKLAKKLDVKIIVTGFINSQEELFRHYYISDAFILPSTYEAWGLVVNEAMFAGLTVIVSDVCGCSLDLVKENNNGFKIDPYDIDDIKSKIDMLFKKENLVEMGNLSKEIISQWTFENSARSFKQILECFIERNLIIADITSLKKDQQTFGHFNKVAENYKEIFNTKFHVLIAGGPIYYKANKDGIVALKYDNDLTYCESIIGRLKIKFKEIYNAISLVRRKSNDIIIFQSYSLKSILLSLLFMRGKKDIYLIQYKNELNSSMNRVIYNLVYKKVKGIICPNEKVGKSYKNKYVVVPDYIYTEKEMTNNKNLYDFAMLGIMSEGKDVEDVVTTFKNTQYKVIIAGYFNNNERYEELIKNKSENIDIINKYLTQSEYENYLNNSKYVILPYKDYYKSASSGVVFDVLFNKKPVITKNYETFKLIDKFNVGILYNNNLKEVDKDKLMYDEFYNMLCSNIDNFLDNNMIQGNRLLDFIENKSIKL